MTKRYLTVLATGQPETEKTNETEKVSNEQFLRAVFGEVGGNGRPVLVSFAGNPASVRKQLWHGKPLPEYDQADRQLPAHHNNYFSLASFRPDDTGQYRRQKKNFQTLHAVMLDDVGTKVELERLTLPPSWLLETSPGNYQAGYLLERPTTDGKVADRLMNAIIAAGLSDPGANGPQTRLARLPNAVNGKCQPPFPCKLLEFYPERRYSIGAIVDGLQLERLVPDQSPEGKTVSSSQPPPSDGDPVWIPALAENPVLVELSNKGLYKKPLDSRRHDITCPWVNEHTDLVDHGTVYFEPDDFYPVGGFKCLHGHCADRHIRELLEFLDITEAVARMRATLRVIPGEINRVVDCAERELAERCNVYQRGSLIVKVITDPGTAETSVLPITQPALTRELAMAATWEKFDGRGKYWVRTDPPANHVGILFDSPSYPHLPVLNGLTRQPYLRPDGSLVTASGYDAATGMFGVFDPTAFQIPESPSRQDAYAAASLLREVLGEFGFVSVTDLSAAVSAILTAAIRPSLATAPMFHVRAHMVGSGKSYLCEVLTAFATPKRGTPTTFPADDEECRKLLLAELLKAPAVIEFDNLTGDLLAHKSLCSALTASYVSGRILGTSKTATVSTRALFLSSGNNVGPIQDMTRRCITIHLDPGCEVPATRDFSRPNLVQEILCDRGRYVSAAFTIIVAWIAAGRPQSSCRPLAGFSEWSEFCRQPLLWLGMADPIASVFSTMAEDPERELLDRLITCWRQVFGSGPAMIRDAIEKASISSVEGAELREIFIDIASDGSDINRRRLGKWISRHTGRIVNGFRLIKASGKRPAEAWRVERVELVSSVSSVCRPLGEKTGSDDNEGREVSSI